MVYHYFTRTLNVLLERYYNGSYRTINELRSDLINTYSCQSVRYRETPKKDLHQWEIKTRDKTYFYNYEPKLKELKFIGVR